MMRSILVLIAVVLGWLAILWFLIVPDFSQWGIPQLATLHVLPPIFAWGGWMMWLRYRQKNAEMVAAERAAAEENERRARREAARAQYDKELQHRTFACDCRALSVAQLTVSGDGPLLPEGIGADFSRVEAAAWDDDEDRDDLLSHLRPAIEEALERIHEQCAVALRFPIYVSPPADASGDEVLACIREVRAAIMVAGDGVSSPEGGSQGPVELGRILFLPVGNSVADRVIGLFEGDPELPGALVLAFDSPAWNERRRDVGGGPDEGELRQQHQWLGRPGQGVVALFLTPTRLAEMLQAAPRFRGEYDAMTPYWEKAPVAASGTLLASLSEDEREALQQSPVMARIHRAATAQFDGKPLRGTELTRIIEPLIERAQINAKLVELPFESPDGSLAESSASSGSEGKADAPPSCTWLIHNAGGVDCSGTRLAALGVAMLNREIDIDPIGEASNLVVRIGDLGAARGAAMLALALARSVDTGGAALCADFNGGMGVAGLPGGGSLSLAFTVVPKEAA